MLAVNRSGVFILSLEGDSAGLKGPFGAEWFANRSLGAFFLSDGRAVCQFYRHPTYEPAAIARERANIVAIDRDGGASPFALPIGPFGDPGPFAVFPSKARSWLVEYRKEADERVSMEYGTLDFRGDPPVAALSLMDRDDFDRGTAPAALRSAPRKLALACAELSPEIGSGLFVYAKLPNGTVAAFADSRGMESGATACFASDGEEASCVLAPDGRGAYAGPQGRVSRFELAPPTADASFTGVAATGSAIVASWEEDFFPDVGASGFLVISVDASGSLRYSK